MAHIVQHIGGSRFYTVVFDPTLPWNSADIFPGGMRLLAIEMVPTSATDSVIVRDGVGGSRIFSHEALGSYDVAVRYYGGQSKYGSIGTVCAPHISADEAIGNFIITFEFA